MMRPTTAPSASTSKSSSFHSPEGREADARLRMRPAIAQPDYRRSRLRSRRRWSWSIDDSFLVDFIGGPQICADRVVGRLHCERIQPISDLGNQLLRRGANGSSHDLKLSANSAVFGDSTS